jgi:tetratricopeptide (TPR) repeat protein
MPHVTAIVIVVMLLSGAASQARADGRETPEYTEAVSLGLAEFEEKNFFEARAQFARAHAIYPNARTKRALGMVYFELKDYVQSARYLSEALGSHDRPLDADKRDKTDKLLKRAQGYIARFTLDIEPETSVTVDGQATSLSSSNELVLVVGEHALEFRAAGKTTDKRTLNVQGGEQEMLRVRLPALQLGAAKGAPETGEKPPGRPVYKSPWLWTALGLVVAGAAAGTAIALTRKPETREPIAGNSGIPPLVGVSQ